MQFEKVEVVEGSTGKQRAASLAVCECNGRVWHVFQVEGDGHFHLECVACGTTQCPHGGDHGGAT